jgi:hypothetical protein
MHGLQYVAMSWPYETVLRSVPQAFFQYLDALVWVEATIYQLDEDNERLAESGSLDLTVATAGACCWNTKSVRVHYILLRGCPRVHQRDGPPGISETPTPRDQRPHVLMFMSVRHVAASVRHVCSSPTSVPHPPLLLTHLCSSPTSVPHPPLFLTHLCSSPTI